jgi:hypothetical protein
VTKSARSAVDQIEFMRSALAILLVGVFVGSIPLFVFKVIPKANEQLITYMVGQLSGMALMALGFYFVNKVGADALDAKKTENTGKMADAIKATAEAASSAAPADAKEAADQMLGASQDKADAIKGDA